jgi:hypothetical protein
LLGFGDGTALDRIADALEDLVKLQIASQGGSARVGRLKTLQMDENSPEEPSVSYTDDAADVKREALEDEQRLLKLYGGRRGGR